MEHECRHDHDGRDVHVHVHLPDPCLPELWLATEEAKQLVNKLTILSQIVTATVATLQNVAKKHES